MRHPLITTAAIAASSLAIALGLAASASANGPCGQDFDGNHACPVNSPVNLTGSLVTDNETDYYIFSAQKGTELSVTITDTEDPSCSTSDDIDCGDVRAELLFANGDNTGQGTESSEPNNNITVPSRFAYTIGATGHYYLVVSGNLGSDQNENPTPVPYTLSVSASPDVQWPPPPPPCVVPKFKVGETLGTLEQHVTSGHCVTAKVVRVHSRHVRRGYVLGLSPGPGTQLAYGSPVTITVSAGPKPRRHKRRRNHRG
jgi:hypothetical protein